MPIPKSGLSRLNSARYLKDQKDPRSMNENIENVIVNSKML